MNTLNHLKLAFEHKGSQTESFRQWESDRDYCKRIPWEWILGTLDNTNCPAHRSNGGRSVHICSDGLHVSCRDDDCPLKRADQIEYWYWLHYPKLENRKAAARDLRQSFSGSPIPLPLAPTNGINQGLILDPHKERWRRLQRIKVDSRMVDSAYDNLNSPIGGRCCTYMGDGRGNFVRVMFLERELDLCLGQQKNHPRIDSVRAWTKRLDINYMNFICPNYLKAGSSQKRRQDLVEGRNYLIVEGDKLPPPTQLACWFELARLTGWKLVCVVFSGNKSYHAWFVAARKSEQECFEFYSIARKLGASMDGWNPEQYTRLPGGTNQDTNEKQRLIYWGGTK